MSDSKDNIVKRNLPSWMSSRDKGTNFGGKEPANIVKDEESNEGEGPKQAKENGRAHIEMGHSNETKISKRSAAISSGSANFSKLLDGVVFVLSGFVNPERSILRSQALEMGAKYQPDWNSNCTLLICAFSNTPKFRQVEADSGTIVSKEWISECYTQKKLVDIERYFMHAGKPWRRSSVPHEANHDQEPQSPRKPQEQVEQLHSKPTPSASSKNGASKPAKDQFSPSKVKKWVIDDLNKTVSWLESQEEKPDATEIKDIAAEGILTCLQDAIDTLEQNQDIREVTEQWGFIPRAVEELAKLDSIKGSPTSIPKEELHRQAMACKRIYETELKSSDDDSAGKKKKAKSGETERRNKGKGKDTSGDAAAYDSDETLEMTEEEINLAYKGIASKC